MEKFSLRPQRSTIPRTKPGQEHRNYLIEDSDNMENNITTNPRNNSGINPGLSSVGTQVLITQPTLNEYGDSSMSPLSMNEKTTYLWYAEKHDDSRNMHRYYMIEVRGRIVIRRYGRVPGFGRKMTCVEDEIPCESEEAAYAEALRIETKKSQRGYLLTEWSS